MAARMDYCGPRGIPLHEFLSWPIDSQEAALWWQARQRETCQGCGTHPSEWDPKQGGHRQAYVPRVVLCPGCMARDSLASTEQAKQAGHGARIALYPNPTI